MNNEMGYKLILACKPTRLLAQPKEGLEMLESRPRKSFCE